MAATTDAVVALTRIGKFLSAEEVAEPYKIDKSSKYAVDVDGDFRWETAYKSSTGGPKFDIKGKHGGKKPDAQKKSEAKEKKDRNKANKDKKGAILPTTATKDSEKIAGENDQSEKMREGGLGPSKRNVMAYR